MRWRQHGEERRPLLLRAPGWWSGVVPRPPVPGRCCQATEVWRQRSSAAGKALATTAPRRARSVPRPARRVPAPGKPLVCQGGLGVGGGGRDGMRLGSGAGSMLGNQYI